MLRAELRTTRRAPFLRLRLRDSFRAADATAKTPEFVIEATYPTWRKVVDKNPEGMKSREKCFWQSLIGLVAALYLAFSVSETSFLGVVQLFFRWI